MTKTVTIPLTVDLDEAWSNTFGAGWETWDWWTEITYHDDAEWDTPGYVTLVSDHPEHERVEVKFGPDEFVAALAKTLSDFPGIRWDDQDASDSDLVFQNLVFGEVVFG